MTPNAESSLGFKNLVSPRSFPFVLNSKLSKDQFRIQEQVGGLSRMGKESLVHIGQAVEGMVRALEVDTGECGAHERVVKASVENVLENDNHLTQLQDEATGGEGVAGMEGYSGY